MELRLTDNTTDEIIKLWWDLEHDGHEDAPMPNPFYDDGVGHEVGEVNSYED